MEKDSGDKSMQSCDILGNFRNHVPGKSVGSMIIIAFSCTKFAFMDWDAEYDLLAVGGGNAGPSLIDRIRNPPADNNDFDHVARPVPAALFVQPEEPDTPLEQLMRHWTNERHAPDILPAQEDLLANLLDHLRRQVRCGFRFNVLSRQP